VHVLGELLVFCAAWLEAGLGFLVVLNRHILPTKYSWEIVWWFHLAFRFLLRLGKLNLPSSFRSRMVLFIMGGVVLLMENGVCYFGRLAFSYLS